MDIKKFSKWLVRRNAVIVEPKSPDEALRFSTTKGDGVIHRSNTGRLLPNDIAAKALRAFVTRNSWTSGYTPQAIESFKRKKRNRDERIAIVNLLAKRDGGMFCAYCGATLTEDEATIEHVLPISKGGADSADNMVIACRKCNQLAKDYSITQKLRKVRETMDKYGAPPEELSPEGTKGYDDIAQAEEAKKKAEETQKKPE